MACPGYTASRLPFLIVGCPSWPHSFCWLPPLFGRVPAYFAQNWSLGLLLPSAHHLHFSAPVLHLKSPFFSFLFLPLLFSLQFLNGPLAPFKCSLCFHWVYTRISLLGWELSVKVWFSNKHFLWWEINYLPLLRLTDLRWQDAQLNLNFR